MTGQLPRLSRPRSSAPDFTLTAEHVEAMAMHTAGDMNRRCGNPGTDEEIWANLDERGREGFRQNARAAGGVLINLLRAKP